MWIFSNLRVFTFYKYDGLSKSVACPQTWNVIQTKMDQTGEHMKKNFDYFQIQTWMLKTVTEQKVDKKV